MIERVAYSREARDDVAQAYDWYENKEPGLGEEFLRSLAATLGAIQRHPKMYPIARKTFRRALLRRFPYEVFYGTDDDTVTIYSVFHSSQDPAEWRKRLE